MNRGVYLEASIPGFGVNVYKLTLDLTDVFKENIISWQGEFWTVRWIVCTKGVTSSNNVEFLLYRIEGKHYNARNVLYYC